MPDRFSAFSFVDRITALESGRRARGRFAISAALPAFSTGLVAEAVGQLAAWAAMAHAGFRRRPVAALAGEMRIVGEAAPGEIVDLGVEIESCDRDAVAYGGWARVADTPVLELFRCVGPMLPLEEFDAPEAARGDFETLCGPGARPGRFPGITAPDLTLIDHIPGQRLSASMHVPVSAPFFGDHFPRRPVFPATLLLDALIRLAKDVAYRTECRAEVIVYELRSEYREAHGISFVEKELQRLRAALVPVDDGYHHCPAIHCTQRRGPADSVAQPHHLSMRHAATPAA
jgi:3-hydroxymyristoyl/3-hydroxydecanoyl-(acyl carrier protein) dehydratase